MRRLGQPGVAGPVQVAGALCLQARTYCFADVGHNQHLVRGQRVQARHSTSPARLRKQRKFSL